MQVNLECHFNYCDCNNNTIFYLNTIILFVPFLHSNMLWRWHQHTRERLKWHTRWQKLWKGIRYEGISSRLSISMSTNSGLQILFLDENKRMLVENIWRRQGNKVKHDFWREVLQKRYLKEFERYTLIWIAKFLLINDTR